MKIFDKIDSNKAGLEQLYKADIPFVSMMAMSRLMLKHNYKAADINKLGKIRREDFVEEVELDEGKKRYNTTSNVGKAKYVINFHDGKKTNKDGSDFFDIKIFKNKPDFENAEKELKSKGYVKEEVELEEKYDLYHKSFSDAMQHAYDYAKKKLGITVDKSEIDRKVATGPKKPTEGKTNKYRLKGKGGNLQIQVYNKGGSKPFELNMYKEGADPLVSLYADQITLNAIKEK